MLTKHFFTKAFAKKAALRLTLVSLPFALIACGGDNDAAVNRLQDDIANLETAIQNLETENTALSTMLADIQASVGTVDATELAAMVAELQARLAELENASSVSFSIEVKNLTNNQPLSPLAVLLHDGEYKAWHIGEAASPGLEMLAESGSPTAFIAEAESAFSSVMADGILAPGDSLMLSLNAQLATEVFARGDLALSLASMPVNTNDAFTGSTGWNISSLKVGESLSAWLPIYDAGTEANTETATTVPGPAAGGEGFNEARDDIANQVTRHPGVVTADDGYADSALNQSHRFAQHALYVTVTRMPN